MSSLARRLGAGLLASLCVVFVAQWALVGYAARQSAERLLLARLGHDAESLVAALSLPARLDDVPLPLVYRTPYAGHYFRIAAGTRVIRSRSLWDTDLEVPRLAPGESATLHLAGPGGQPLLALVRGYRKQGTGVTVTVAEELSSLDHEIAALRLRYTVLSLLVLVALIGVQHLVVRRSLRPLERLRGEVERLERGETRALRLAVPSEVAPVVEEVNRLVAVMTARLERSRAALGNLAHALKAPLTLLVHAARDPALHGHPALRARLEQETASIGRLIERELRRARFAGAAPGARFDAQREIPDLVQVLRQLHAGRELAIEWQAPPQAVLPADREDMLELLGNLLDNACKWARGRVSLRIETAAGWRIRVEDDGPGCAPQELERITARGVRADESRAGHGLGLAIVRGIVEQYGGTLRFGRSATLGGLLAEVALPG